MNLAYRLLRPVLFGLPPERVHGLTLAMLKSGLLGGSGPATEPRLAQTLFGLTFPNPVGLAAGFDKNAEVPDAMLRLGFGFAECGTVTPKPQSGNPRPRIFRLTDDKAVINRLGFNNEGHDAALMRLQRRQGKGGIVGINIGANKDSPDRAGDYVEGYRRLAPFASYVTINISSPNTPGLRGLQNSEELADLLGRVCEERRAHAVQRPVFLKIAPDLDAEAISAIVEACVSHGIDALIVSNTTISRPENLRSSYKAETGGLSGAPLLTLSTQALALAFKAARGRLPLIGAGGIANADDAYLKIAAGARLVQLYTGMIFHGPGLAADIARGLAARLKRENITITHLCGRDVGALTSD